MDRLARGIQKRAQRGNILKDVQEDEYKSVDLPACAKLHFINRKTGKLWAENADVTNS